MGGRAAAEVAASAATSAPPSDSADTGAAGSRVKKRGKGSSGSNRGSSAAEDAPAPGLSVLGLVLSSYPLHPPGKPVSGVRRA